MDSKHYRYRRRARIKHQLIWFSLLILYFKVCFSLLIWGYEKSDIGENWSLGMISWVELLLLVISLGIAAVITHLLAGPLELKKLD